SLGNPPAHGRIDLFRMPCERQDFSSCDNLFVLLLGDHVRQPRPQAFHRNDLPWPPARAAAASRVLRVAMSSGPFGAGTGTDRAAAASVRATTSPTVSGGQLSRSARSARSITASSSSIIATSCSSSSDKACCRLSLAPRATAPMSSLSRLLINNRNVPRNG